MINLHYYTTLLYYRIFNPYEINHYNVINKLYCYKSLGNIYYYTYPNAKSSINMNDELFLNNPKAKSDFLNTHEIQQKLKKSILYDLKIISNDTQNYNINTIKFKTFYIEKDYHIEQNIDALISELKKDIIIKK